ncbi:hypothetical protein AB0M43_35565 [Longispora sp. NPDC051575]|uniref:hypothetical protein n=1 Tax=Longispora sp. NPDC051575 TaxID=3154943 RepID=UPI00342E684E
MIFTLGALLTGLGMIGVIDAGLVSSAVLGGVTFLVLRSRPPSPTPGLDGVLRDRRAFGALPQLLKEVSDLRVYGPSAVNVVVHAAEIRRTILRRGGQARVVVQAPEPRQLAITARQLDESLDLPITLATTMSGLRRLADAPGFEWRLLDFNPGFSLLVVNADTPEGFVIVEFHGFRDDSIADRMHVRITRAESPHWFAYWCGRFDRIWETAIPEDGPTGSQP